ncbi:MAG: alpha/beta hydrolase [Okeania sp. SIO2C9]|uniref:alpha/beta hydrolase n=1 Tax=Okeania sp. SIO2C9 TaxID=2607791 RepID=UPI0013C11E96|nr:alpha/beta hydrolase [Okeania sp. SIO2C9]NEQ73825.1 alpha/beta hydrolase [Okeania sp. SIO2C9]
MLQPNLSEILQFWWLVPLLLSILGLFFSLWIVIPAPNSFLLPLAVATPEISPWLICLNLLALILTVFIHKTWWSALIFISSLLSLILSLLPLSQLATTNTNFAVEMETVLGTDYLQSVPEDLKAQMRPQPFVLADVFRGLPKKEVQTQRGIVFASPDGVDLKLNVYQPLVTQKLHNFPTVVIVYGGAWRQGSPDNYERFSCYIAAQGYSVIAIDYRHAPKYKFPAQIEDVRAALQYIQAHADNLKVDIERIAIMGRSAGGHLATLAAYEQGAMPFRAVVSYYAPSDLIEGFRNPPFPNPINTNTVLRDFLGGTPDELLELYQKASPKSYVRTALPPSLLVYAGRDHIVQPKFGRILYTQLRATGNQAIFLEIPWAEHSFDAVFPGISNQLALYYTERFLASVLHGVISNPVKQL